MTSNRRHSAAGSRRVMGVIASALALGVVGGLLCLSAVGAAGPSRPSVGPLPGDVDGDQVISDAGDERIPALIAAVGDSGLQGYVRLEDLFGGPPPSNPSAALRESRRVRVIPVYAADGVTIIDRLTESPDASVIERTAEELNEK